MTRAARESLESGQALPSVLSEGRGRSCSTAQLESAVQNTMIILLLCEESFLANNLHSLRLSVTTSATLRGHACINAGSKESHVSYTHLSAPITQLRKSEHGGEWLGTATGICNGEEVTLQFLMNSDQ